MSYCHVMSIIFTISDMNFKKLFLLLLMFFFDISCNIIEANKDRKTQVKVCWIHSCPWRDGQKGTAHGLGCWLLTRQAAIYFHESV